ncbi:MAG: small ribosomal subunit biogenesis GTPase RsgA, partial [Gammaproteobacteria bacterium]
MGRRRTPPLATPRKSEHANSRPGLVLAHHGQASLVESESGDVLRCATRRNLPRTVCGDRVLWDAVNPREGVVTQVLERRTTLVRPDRNNRPRPVAANLDQIVVVLAARPGLDPALLDRYLVAAELMGATPVVVVNKLDLLDGAGRERVERRLALCRQLGYCLLFTSTRNADGLKSLHRQLRSHTSILVGQSGVGKSSLIKALLPDRDIRVGALSRLSGLGRHTTTVAMLYHLPDGGDLIDSPGVRDFSLCPVPPEELARGFVEFRPYLGQCRFHNCRHLSEPGCAVQAAVRSGSISRQRLGSYQHLAAA